MLKPLDQSQFNITLLRDLGIRKTKKGQSVRWWVFKCTKCEQEVETSIQYAKTIDKILCISCRKKNISKVHTADYDTNTRLYSIWAGMKSRCNVNSMNSTNHGKRGITVCDEWINSYTAFRDWALTNGYKDTLPIDRINNNADYSPSNCRWTDQKVQSSNTRVLYSHNKSGYRGISWNKQYSKWEVSISIDKKTIKIGYYDNVKDAAAAYDTYVIKNKLPHTINGIGYEVQSNTGSNLITTNTSGYVGVSYVKRLANTNKPWTAQINIRKNGKQIRLYNKYFTNPKEAAIARDKFIVDNKLKNKRNFTDKELYKLLTGADDE